VFTFRVHRFGSLAHSSHFQQECEWCELFCYSDLTFSKVLCGFWPRFFGAFLDFGVEVLSETGKGVAKMSINVRKEAQVL